MVMNLGSLMLAGMLMAPGQASGDLYAMKEHSIKIPIQFDPSARDEIQQVILFASRNRGKSWEQESVAGPQQDSFTFQAPSDGIYWFSLMVIDKQGRRDPPDIYRAGPALKVLVDGTPPSLRLKVAEWSGDEILVGWEVNDDYPDPNRFRLEYSVGGSPTWHPVPEARMEQGHVRFRLPKAGEDVRVRIQVADKAGNERSAERAVSGRPPRAESSGYTPEPKAPNIPRIPEPSPSSLGDRAAPSPPASGTQRDPALFPATMNVALPDEIPTGTGGTDVAPVREPDPPTSAPEPKVSPLPTVGDSPQPVAVSNDYPSTPTNRSLPSPQAINVTQFDLAYTVEDQGPSGVGQVELWVTRDEGRTWHRWATDEDLQSPIRVNLDVEHNPQLEGIYGFKVVVQSGAGLGKGPPVSGDIPEMMVNVDITKPIVKIYNPTADPNRRDTLIIRWESTDRLLAPTPIALDWSELPDGPWHPMTSTSDDASTVGSSVEPGNQTRGEVRLPNTGSYAWRVPANIPTHRVYLRIRAWDAAGNVAEARTTQPIEIDLNKPTAKIQGIIGTNPIPR